MMAPTRKRGSPVRSARSAKRIPSSSGRTPFSATSPSWRNAHSRRSCESAPNRLLFRLGLGGKVRIDAVVERKFHAQAWVLFQHVLAHLSGIFGFADIDIPVGDVLLHKIDC